MATGSFPQFNAHASHHAVVVLLVLGATPSLANHTNVTAEVLGSDHSPAFLILDLTFHGHWQLSQVQHHRP